MVLVDGRCGIETVMLQSLWWYAVNKQEKGNIYVQFVYERQIHNIDLIW